MRLADAAWGREAAEGGMDGAKEADGRHESPEFDVRHHYTDTSRGPGGKQINRTESKKVHMHRSSNNGRFQL